MTSHTHRGDQGERGDEALLHCRQLRRHLCQVLRRLRVVPREGVQGLAREVRHLRA